MSQTNTLSQKDIMGQKDTMSPTIPPPPPTFPHFPDMPVELQIMVITHALKSEIHHRKGKLVIRLHRNPTSQNKKTDKLSSTSRSPRPFIQLPKLPAIYHTTRFFRAEALRTQPLHSLLADSGLKTLLYRRDSKVLFNPTHDTVVLNLRDRNASRVMLDGLLDSLFDLTGRIGPCASLKCVFKIGPTVYRRAAETYTRVVESAMKYPEFPSCSTARLVRERESGKMGVWQVGVDFRMG